MPYQPLRLPNRQHAGVIFLEIIIRGTLWQTLEAQNLERQKEQSSIQTGTMG
jgi:hypothetical protein